MEVKDAEKFYNVCVKNPTLENKQMFVDAHRGYFCLVASKCAHPDYEDMHDLQADIFVELMKKAYKLDFSRSYGELKSYMGQITVNTIKNITIANNAWKRIPKAKLMTFKEYSDILNLKTRHVEDIDDDFYADPKTVKEHENNLEDRVDDILRNINNKERFILLKMVDGYSQAQIGDMLGINDETVRRYIKSARRKIG